MATSNVTRPNTLGVKLSKFEDNALTAIAVITGMNRSDVIRDMIRRKAEKLGIAPQPIKKETDIDDDLPF